MITENYIEPDALIQRIGHRKVYVWGARHDGYAASLMLSRIGIEMTAFIDSSPSIQNTEMFGFNVFSPDDFFNTIGIEDSFILISSGFYADEISEVCDENGCQKGIHYMVYGELRKFNYQVDISGSCNLKCISCPRGNEDEHRPLGIMSAEVYQKVVEKILREDPYTGIITLYNWGEPLLNKHLPEIVRITRENNLLSAISSNLSLKLDFEPVIAAKPTWFRVSNSGWGENYEKTHTGGKWDLFYENLFKLKEYREKHHPEMIVEFFFHIYSHNRGDYPKIQALCDELGFTLRHRHAALAPLDNIERVYDGKPLSKEAEETQVLQFFKVEEVQKIAQSPKEIMRPCFYEDHLWINWDLQVAHCMEWYKPGLNLVEKDFLSVTAEELWDARVNSSHCAMCKSKGIHRTYTVYGDEKLIEEKQSVPVCT